jgi:predicted methyltransferase
LQKSPPKARVLDIGGNVGYYSLLSAASGAFVVDGFEPNLKNLLRFCESSVLNRWTNEFEMSSSQPHLNIYAYGVSDHAGELPFYVRRNPGEGSFGKH